ncbi:unnamed protein product [Durusdinium trenchii]|uniref:Uncharacterized protein n=1 Tax=Durusdinium trenchii TaxID=1381693 RepID=A0ABP0KBI0_9DINO
MPEPELSKVEAIELLLAYRELLLDEELQENLAGLDEHCGGVMARWQPPWIEEGIEGMNFGGAEKLEKLPVVKWVRALQTALQELHRRAQEAEFLPSCEAAFIVVLPAQCSQLQSISLLARLGGGAALLQPDRNAAEALPCSRLIFLDAFAGQKVEDAPIARSPVKEGPPSEVNGHKPATHADARAADAGEGRPNGATVVPTGPTRRLPSTIKFLHLEILQVEEEAIALILGVMQLLREEEIWKRCLALDTYCDGLLSHWQPPWIEDGSFDELEMSLERLRSTEDAQVFDWAMALDGFCSFVANLALAARVHQAASGDSRVEARPRRGAAKQFGAHLEALARRQRTGSSAQHSGLARSQGVCRMLQGILDGRNYRGELGSSSLRAELVPSVGRSHAMPSSLPRILQAQVPGSERQQQEGPTLESDGAPQAGRTELVVVVPDDLAEWHLEVLGPLLRAFKIFMLTEKAWRADFQAAPHVSFSVQAASAASRSCVPWADAAGDDASGE